MYRGRAPQYSDNEVEVIEDPSDEMFDDYGQRASRSTPEFDRKALTEAIESARLAEKRKNEALRKTHEQVAALSRARRRKSQKTEAKKAAPQVASATAAPAAATATVQNPQHVLYIPQTGLNPSFAGTTLPNAIQRTESAASATITNPIATATGQEQTAPKNLVPTLSSIGIPIAQQPLLYLSNHPELLQQQQNTGVAAPALAGGNDAGGLPLVLQNKQQVTGLAAQLLMKHPPPIQSSAVTLSTPQLRQLAAEIESITRKRLDQDRQEDKNEIVQLRKKLKAAKEETRKAESNSKNSISQQEVEETRRQAQRSMRAFMTAAGRAFGQLKKQQADAMQ